MIDEEYMSRIKLATELATKKITAIHRKKREKAEDKNEIYQYESLLQAMIYHELIMLGIYFGDVTMDNPIESDNEELKKKKPDMWIENTESGKSYVLEIKMIIHHEKNKIIKQINEDKENSIIKDVQKLSLAMRAKPSNKGMMVVSYVSPNFAENEDPVDIMDNEFRKIVKKIKPPNSLIFMLCSEDFCRVLTTKEILKG